MILHYEMSIGAAGAEGETRQPLTYQWRWRYQIVSTLTGRYWWSQWYTGEATTAAECMKAITDLARRVHEGLPLSDDRKPNGSAHRNKYKTRKSSGE